MLSKEECEKALLILKQEYDSNPYVIVLFEDLINEHFELVEEYKGVRKELECYYEMMSNAQPYKFEDLKYGLWVWDEKNKMCLRICKTKEKENIKDLIVVGGNQYWIENFEENRFYPVQMANVRCEW